MTEVRQKMKRSWKKSKTTITMSTTRKTRMTGVNQTKAGVTETSTVGPVIKPTTKKKTAVQDTMRKRKKRRTTTTAHGSREAKQRRKAHQNVLHQRCGLARRSQSQNTVQ